MLQNQLIALERGGRIYTLKPFKGDAAMKLFKWIGFCEGDRCGFFKTKRDFEQFVANEPEIFPPSTEQTRASMRAETWSTHDGHVLLQKLIGGFSHANMKESGQ